MMAGGLRKGLSPSWIPAGRKVEKRFLLTKCSRVHVSMLRFRVSSNLHLVDDGWVGGGGGGVVWLGGWLGDAHW